jgi:transposase
MDHDMCGSGARWYARADAMFNSDGMHVPDVARGHRKLVITVETDADVTGCPSCGVLAVGHGRRRVRAADAPCFGLPVLLIWLKRIWGCAEPDCPAQTWSEVHDLVGPRAVFTSRAIGWATDALAHHDTTVSALARHLRVGWHTLWRAVEAEADARISRPGRLTGVPDLRRGRAHLATGPLPDGRARGHLDGGVVCGLWTSLTRCSRDMVVRSKCCCAVCRP